jgi:large subunit ribosomal protein L25
VRRAKAAIPAVIYGDKKELRDDQPSTARAVRSRAAQGGLFQRICSTCGASMARSIAPCRATCSLHPVTDEPVHIDFVRVTAHTKTHVNVPVRFRQSCGLARA